MLVAMNFFFFIIKRTPTLKDKLDEPGRDRKGFECHRVAALQMFFFLKKLVLLVFLYLLLIVLISNMIKLLQAENGILTLKEEKSRKE